jgi:predicted DNA-binding protein
MAKIKHKYLLLLPIPTYHRLKLFSITKGQPMSQIIIQAVEKLLESGEVGEVNAKEVLAKCQERDKLIEAKELQLSEKRMQRKSLNLNFRKVLTEDQVRNNEHVMWNRDKLKDNKLKKEVSVLVSELKDLNRGKQGRPPTGDFPVNSYTTDAEIAYDEARVIAGFDKILK